MRFNHSIIHFEQLLNYLLNQTCIENCHKIYMNCITFSSMAMISFKTKLLGCFVDVRYVHDFLL